jgi:hypothetical protein|tara:strand:+ start:1316 stop:1735 length:420 start_codon:yes stop_codon:yes gene_type:complete
MSAYNYLSNDVTRNQVAQSYYTVTGDISEADLSNDHNVATDALTIGIPLITSGNLGSTIFFRNTGADAAVKLVISPKNTNKIIGSITLAASVFAASGVLDKDVINTKATALKGDWIALRAVSLTEWYIIGGQGIWASEA